jgi:hypothetical protein
VIEWRNHLPRFLAQDANSMRTSPKTIELGRGLANCADWIEKKVRTGNDCL